ncbi:MAG: hypothetical protein V1936_03770 [Patescibacteria group bacterium]
MKKIHSKNRNLVGGILLTVFAAAILGAVGFFLFQKYSQPSSLAEILPADETLFFAEMRLGANSNKLGKFFADESKSNLLALDSLGLTEPENLLALAQSRVGVAFLGEKFDPQNFVLALDTPDQNAVLDFFSKEVLSGEELASRNFVHQKIYYFPRSRPLAFMFFGGDLLLAASSESLEKIATAIHIPEKRVANSAAFRAVAEKLNPRADGFIFATPKFLEEFFTRRFEGETKALATPVLDLWSGGGATFEPTATGLKVSAQLVLKNSATLSKPFLEVPSLNPEILNLWGEETQTFLANQNLAGQLDHFLAAGGAQNSPLAPLLKSSANNFLQTWLGQNFKAEDFKPIFGDSSAIGLTATGGVAGIFAGNFENVFTKIQSATGKIAAAEKVVELPDTTTGQELTAETKPQSETEIFAGNQIQTWHFPKYDLNFAQLEDWSVFATEKDVLEKMISRFVGEEKFLDKAPPPSQNIFYTRLGKSENPFLKPFSFLLAGVNFESDSVKIELSLEK